ncbi:hypothetical protein Tco_1174503 [Tanacetum coccineum]
MSDIHALDHSLLFPILAHREVSKDKAYAELERKCNEALLDLDKSPLVLDMRFEIETLQGHVDGLHSEYSKLVLEENKCTAFEEVASLKEPFILEKMSGYHPYASVEKFLSKKPQSLRSNPTSSHSKPSSLKVSSPALVSLVWMSESGKLRTFGSVPSHDYALRANNTLIMLLACTRPTHHSHGDKYDLRYSLSSIILYMGALIRSFLAFCVSLGSIPNWLTNISPAPEPSELEAPSVNNFHVFSGSGSFSFGFFDFNYSVFCGGVSAKKSANICPLT